MRWTNEVCILFYSPCLLMSIIFFISVLRRDKKHFVIRKYISFCISVILWLLFTIMCHILKDPFWIAYLINLKIAVMAITPISQFLLVLGYYRLTRKIPRGLLLALYIVPLISTVLALTSPLHSLLLREITIVSLQPVLITKIIYGPWYFVHLLYCLLFLFANFCVILVSCKKLPKAYRGGTNILIAAAIIACLGLLFEISSLNHSAIDFTLLGTSLACALLYIASVTTGRTNYLQIGGKEVFDYLNEAVFIVSEDKILIDANEPALKWLHMLGHKMQNISITQMANKLIKEEKISIRENGDKTDIYLIGTPFPIIYNVQRINMQQQGESMLVLNDITRTKLIVERLRETAGVDMLTGIANRHKYQELLRQLDSPENYPLSIVMGDANSLKHVNDTYGHDEGDRMLITIAQTLRSVCPVTGEIARIGGDEFAMLLPRCDEQMAAQIIININIKLEIANIDTLKVRPTIALGSATKKLMSENLNTLVSEADLSMYNNKILKHHGESELTDTDK